MNPIYRLLAIGLPWMILVNPGGAGAAPPLWGKLAPGPYAVGFRSVWQLDYSRRYNTTFDDKTTYADGKAPRPILINLWYPAEKPDAPKPMPHRDYLAIRTEDPRLSRFASKLIEFERSTVCKEMTDKVPAELTDRQRQLLDRFWDTPTACLRDAPPVDGKFPLIIYHSGFGSSFQDNAVLCEFLASHGYVVIGSAYPDATGHSLNVGGSLGSMRDMEFLIAHARRNSYVDWSHIGLVGHSGGAQYSILFRSQDASPIDAVVSLDTTQDYYSITTRGWEYMTKPVLEAARNLDGPLLMAANAHAIFQFADALQDAERYYLTFHELGHNDFIDQGIQRRVLECESEPGKAELRDALEASRAAYEALCDDILVFFDVYLKHPTDEARRRLREKHARNKLGGPAPHLDYVPAGVSGPEPYRDDSDSPPTPRQFRPVLSARGVAATIALLERFREKAPQAPVYQRDFGDSLIEELFDQGRTPDAVAFYKLYTSFDKRLIGTYTRRGDRYLRYGARDGARKYYKMALTLDPADAAAAEGLKSLEASKKP